MLFVIPGIIWWIKFRFFSYFIVDKGFGPIKALKKSSEITRDVKLDLFLFEVLLRFINVVGALCLVVGLVITVPVTLVANAYVYRELLKQTQVTPDFEISKANEDKLEI
ncbi:hypothetical protein BBF96_08240 [Anoxybacter fermentans]|uniref:DUF7847 domain-containing protein n=1 Tax=Anoxybacter fermentans TaxID=1323375 RepID=A0A3S9SYX2_9FIRM|nr:hypothetical protein [Anoxybacter fermentans]AZR73372.1 hypothetical protein BBF96_08240 [Anoxybacter fermentans]